MLSGKFYGEKSEAETNTLNDCQSLKWAYKSPAKNIDTKPDRGTEKRVCLVFFSVSPQNPQLNPCVNFKDTFLGLLNI